MAADELAPLDDLDCAFTLPENITDEKWRHLYEVLVVRMRREAAHLTMTTVQQLLIERIAYNYIVLRDKEARSGTKEGFAHATAQKEFNTFWLTMTQEFNRQMRSTDQDFRDSLKQVVGQALTAVLDEIDDTALRNRVKTRLADQLEKAGI